jgi:hypothetical protein
MNESEKLRTIACYLPIISLFVKNPNELGKIGRVTSNWFTVLLLVIVTLGFTEISQLALSSLYILFVVSLGVFIFLNKEPTFLRLVAFLPKKEAVQAGIYTIPLYLWQVVQAIIGKRSELSFLEEFTKKLQKEEQFEKAMSEVFTDNSSPFSPYTLYIPGINAIHLTTFFSPKKSRNVIASGQGIIITILFALGIYFFNEYDSILLVLVYVSLLGIARVKERPFYKIPVVYEIY